MSGTGFLWILCWVALVAVLYGVGRGCMPEEGAGLPEQFGSPCGIGIAVAY